MAERQTKQAGALKPKRQRFVDEYLIDCNAAQAAIRAGYSAHTARTIGQELLTFPDIKKAVDAGMVKLAKRTGVTAERVIAEIARIGFADIRPIVSFGPDGVKLTPSEDLTPEQAATVSEVGETKDGTMRIKFHDKLGALRDLGRHLGLFVDKQETTITTLTFADMVRAANGQGRPAVPGEGQEQGEGEGEGEDNEPKGQEQDHIEAKGA